MTTACWITGCTQPPAVQWRRRRADDDIDAVFACLGHTITLDGAAHVHQPSCVGTAGSLPACGCTPEPISTTAPPTHATETLPTGWVVPTPASAPAVPIQPSAPTAGPTALS
ncbi:hypothetical protein [Kitasatospora sp. NPDC056531]|uniref:hypothetical protein n=1 Tax=Kitasatospora sp. NPDC056531 TaxID=3345856 RepID=UPI003689E439